MFNSQILRTGYPVLHLYDKVSFALSLMEDFEIKQLPVINEEVYLGLISKADLLDTDENFTLDSLQDLLINVFAKSDDQFLSSLYLLKEHHLTLVPVLTDKGEILGVINQEDLIAAIYNFIGGDENGGVIVLEIDKRHYSFGEICRLVETNDAMIMQLNTSFQKDTGKVLATIKINKTEISDIVATFQRYEYDVKYYFGDEHFNNELKDNYHHLMNYLNI